MLSFVDYYLDRITMYRLVLYVLLGYVGISIILSFFNLLPFTPLELIFSGLFITGIAYVTNIIFSHVFEAPSNIESVFITSLILTLIITPASTQSAFVFLGWEAVLSQASKYILAMNKKHFFNPAAIAVVITALVNGDSASWWVGTTSLFPFILILGLLIIRKMRLEDLVFTFILTTISLIGFFAITTNASVVSVLNHALFHSALFFMASIMLTEPFTMPYRKQLQIYYAILVGVLFVPYVHLGPFYFTPEVGLIIGNVFAYLVNPKVKLLLKLKEKVRLSSSVIDFVFTPTKRLSYIPGQYMEWTLPHNAADSRGNRRYFTLASSPTEPDIRLGVKFSESGSTFKKALATLSSDTVLTAGQLAGDFILPKDKTQKLVFVAGGIGITPFRSMIKYLLDTNEKRDIVLVFMNRFVEDITYTDVFNEGKVIGLRAIYTLTDKTQIPSGWTGPVGRLDESMLRTMIPDFLERIFYLSGPHTMVIGAEDVLKKCGISDRQIKKDFFPGLT